MKPEAITSWKSFSPFTIYQWILFVYEKTQFAVNQSGKAWSWDQAQRNDLIHIKVNFYVKINIHKIFKKRVWVHFKFLSILGLNIYVVSSLYNINILSKCTVFQYTFFIFNVVFLFLYLYVRNCKYGLLFITRFLP